jgi:hypothetical protein
MVTLSSSVADAILRCRRHNMAKGFGTQVRSKFIKYRNNLRDIATQSAKEGSSTLADWLSSTRVLTLPGLGRLGVHYSTLKTPGIFLIGMV